MSANIRDARFYLVANRDPKPFGDLHGLSFDQAFEQASALVKTRYPVHVVYTAGATQMQLTKFLSHGIQTKPKATTAGKL